MPSSTPYSTPTATSHTKNNATDSTNASFSTDHGSTRLICRLARLGPRPGRRNADGAPGAAAGGRIEVGGGGAPKFTVVLAAGSVLGRASGCTPDWPAVAANTDD